MANKQRGEVKITLDKERTLRFDLNALVEVEENLGFSLTELGDNISIKALRTLLTAGLKHEDPEITEQFVGSLIDFENMEEVQNALAVAMGDLKN